MVGLPAQRPVTQLVAGAEPGLRHRAANSLGRRITLVGRDGERELPTDLGLGAVVGTPLQNHLLDPAAVKRAPLTVSLHPRSTCGCAGSRHSRDGGSCGRRSPIGGVLGDVRGVVRALRAVKATLAVAARRRRIARTVLGSQALHRRPSTAERSIRLRSSRRQSRRRAWISVPSTEKCPSDRSVLTLGCASTVSGTWPRSRLRAASRGS